MPTQAERLLSFLKTLMAKIFNENGSDTDRCLDENERLRKRLSQKINTILKNRKDDRLTMQELFDLAVAIANVCFIDNKRCGLLSSLACMFWCLGLEQHLIEQFYDSQYDFGLECDGCTLCLQLAEMQKSEQEQSFVKGVGQRPRIFH